jgi:hypothetical protein
MSDTPRTPQQVQTTEEDQSVPLSMSFDLEVAHQAKHALCEYYWRQHWFCGNNNDDILLSAMIRVDQTIFLLKKILDLLDNFPSDNSEQLFLEAQTYVESFYYLAFSAIRLLELHCERWEPALRERSLTRPYFMSLRDKVKGVRNVRNQLIEHPESRDGILFWGGLKIGEPGGPILKFIDPFFVRDLLGDKNHPDAGLFVNAKEFYEKLKQCSERSNKELIAKGAKIYRKTDSGMVVC